MYENLNEWFDDKEMSATIRGDNNKKRLQFCGFELILNPDKTYILIDTSG